MPGFLRILRAAALIAVVAGAVGSVGLMLYTGRQAPLLLKVLFAIWVLAPFILLAVAHVISKRWPVPTRATLYSVMVALTLGSLAIYTARALKPPKTQGAFVFVLVPPASGLLAAVSVAAAALISRRATRRAAR